MVEDFFKYPDYEWVLDEECKSHVRFFVVEDVDKEPIATISSTGFKNRCVLEEYNGQKWNTKMGFWLSLRICFHIWILGRVRTRQELIDEKNFCLPEEEL